MATMPPEMPAPMGEMPAAPEAEGKVVCIAMSADGTFKVYMNEEDDSVQKIPGMEPTPAPEGQSASSIDDALEMARQMLEGAPSEEMSVEQAFQGGFNGEQPKGAY